MNKYTNEQIIEIVKSYFEKNNQVILIDGQWGSGKTYFIKNELMKKLNGINIIYISLYGKSKIEELEQAIDLELSIEFIKENAGKLGSELAENKYLDMVDTITRKSVGIVNILKKGLASKLSLEAEDINIKWVSEKFKGYYLILDDLERCNININLLLGHINELAEHYNVKVLLVGNEEELRLSDKSDNGSREEYDKTKEKVIGLKLGYKSSLREISDKIIDEVCESEECKLFIKSNFQVINDAFRKNNTSNLRTVRSIIIRYESIYTLVKKSMEGCEGEFIGQHLREVFIYVVNTYLRQTLGKRDKEERFKEIRYFRGQLEEGEENYFVAYKFVDIYLSDGYLNKDEAMEQISEYTQREIDLIKNTENENALALIQLRTWYYLEDDCVKNLLNKLQEEIQEGRYPSKYFNELIGTVFSIERGGFENVLTDAYKKEMEGYIITKIESEGIENLGLGYYHVAEDEYEEFRQFTEKYIDATKNQKKNKENSILNIDRRLFSKEFYEYCEANYHSFILQKGFFKYIDISNVANWLSSESIKGIYGFIDGIKLVYRSDNLYEFFQDDLKNIGDFLSRLNQISNQETSITRRLALSNLKDELERAKKVITKEM